MITQEQFSTRKNRIHWMDNLRSIIIFLVVSSYVGSNLVVSL